MPGPDAKKSGWGSGETFKAFRVSGPLLGSGIQLAAAVVFFIFAGRWLDGKFGTAPWLMLVGALVGVGGGMYNFIRTAIAVGSAQDREGEELKKHDED